MLSRLAQLRTIVPTPEHVVVSYTQLWRQITPQFTISEESGLGQRLDYKLACTYIGHLLNQPPY